MRLKLYLFLLLKSSFKMFLLSFTTAHQKSIVSFMLNESESPVTLNKVNSFKRTLCKNLRLVQAEVAFVVVLKIPQHQLVFQLPSESLPLLRHCIGWSKDWLFSLDVCGVQISGKDIISVQELKISQLRLQEDPGTIMEAKMCGSRKYTYLPPHRWLFWFPPLPSPPPPPSTPPTPPTPLEFTLFLHMFPSAFCGRGGGGGSLLSGTAQ